MCARTVTGFIICARTVIEFLFYAFQWITDLSVKNTFDNFTVKIIKI
jgi:hypothetical protein